LFNLWKIKIKESKSTHITFTLSLKSITPVFLNDKIIPMDAPVKYLGSILITHIKTKLKSLNLRLLKLRQLLRSKISLENKMLIYKQLMRPATTYGI